MRMNFAGIYQMTESEVLISIGVTIVHQGVTKEVLVKPDCIIYICGFLELMLSISCC